MRLKTFLKKLDLESLLPDKKIEIITRKFDEIKYNAIYFSFDAINKKNFEQIRNKGAYLIIGESNYLNNHYIKVDSVKKIYQKYLLWQNRFKLFGKCFIGVTGTCGKSTISTILFRFLRQRKKVIYYGTDGIFTNDKVITSNNTTPSMEVFFENLKGQNYVIMEISSISFFEYRLFNIKFDYLILTNIYEDHLDYHKTKEEYIASKMLILATNYKAKAFISRDVDDIRFLRLNENTFYYGLSQNEFKIFNIMQKNDKLQFDLETSNDYFHISTKILGKYNVMNFSGACSVLLSLGYKMKEIIAFVNKTSIISGRYNILMYNNKPIIIDYCHTASSYEALLKDVKENYGNNLLVVFGAGGSRQESKRIEYSKLVSKYATKAIISNDNPREEDELEIAKALYDNLNIPSEIILDRGKAINKALDHINEYDAILILGKGPERYINIKGVKYEFSDIDKVKEYLR